MNLKLGELCAGYGGLGMAVEEVFGAETAWFSEFDAAPSAILETPLARRPKPRRHDTNRLGRHRTRGHHQRRHTLPGPQCGRPPQRNDRRHPLESLGADARSNSNPATTIRGLGKRERGIQCRSK